MAIRVGISLLFRSRLRACCLGSLELAALADPSAAGQCVLGPAPAVRSGLCGQPERPEPEESSSFPAVWLLFCISSPCSGQGDFRASGGREGAEAVKQPACSTAGLCTQVVVGGR